MASTVLADSVVHEEDGHDLITGEAVALDLRAASFVLRAAGTMIDFIVYFGGYVLIVIILLTFAGNLGLDEAITAAIAVAGLVICIVVIPTAVETVSQGKSLGRLAVGARIVRDDGGAIGFRHAFIRALIGVIEIYMTFGSIAAIVALLNSRAKRMGDLVAGTYSQYERVSREVPPAYGVPEDLNDWSLTADVARMPDQLARRVAHFLSAATGFSAATRAQFSRGLAAEVSVYVSPIPDVDPELFLAGVAAVRRTRELEAWALQRRALAALDPVLRGAPRGFPDRG